MHGAVFLEGKKNQRKDIFTGSRLFGRRSFSHQSFDERVRTKYNQCGFNRFIQLFIDFSK
jgi:hypothetical protein